KTTNNTTTQNTTKHTQLKKQTDKNSGEFITAGELEEGIELVTIHTVEFIDKAEYESLTADDTHYLG
ncbi:hypothetical protein KC218_20815, partial [Mycobacterium tuberculosis]|nr:hypothetical protein [Mycobacterium tuberculosis]